MCTRSSKKGLSFTPKPEKTDIPGLLLSPLAYTQCTANTKGADMTQTEVNTVVQFHDSEVC